MGEDDRAEMNEAHLRMTRIPKGADLILYKVSGSPRLWIGNVIVRRACHRSCRRCSIRPKFKSAVRMLPETRSRGCALGGHRD
jgi:hypothetical protein